MWKFKPSKFKNAAPKMPKKEEVISDINVGNLLPSCGNHIKASSAYMAFNTESAGGGNLCVLPLNETGRRRACPVLQAHADFVTDFDFSPFNDYVLATCSSDNSVKLWTLPEGGLGDSVISADMTLTHEERRVENVLWNPAVDATIAITAHKTLKVFDLQTQQALSAIEVHSDQTQGVSWKLDGSLLVTSGKDKMIKIVDPRAGNVVQEADGHPNIKDSRVLWMGNKDLILSTGFDSMRNREIKLRDVRNLKGSLARLSLDTSTGAMMPLYDVDTGMLFLAGKGDTSIRYLEVTDTSFMENATDMVEQIRGLAMVPKRAVDVMKCEVNRLLILTQHTVVPIPYCVPRKSYREFHEDLFPLTACGQPSMTSQEWFSGANTPIEKMSLDPAKRSPKNPTGWSGSEGIKPTIVTSGNNGHITKPVAHQPEPEKSVIEKPSPAAKPSFTPKPVVTPKPNLPSRESTPEPKIEDSTAPPSGGVANLARSFQSIHNSSAEKPTFMKERKTSKEESKMPEPEPVTAPEPVPVKAPVSTPMKAPVATPVKATPEPKQEAGEASPSPSVASLTKSFQFSQPKESPPTSEKPVIMREKKTKVFAGVRQSKFRFLKGTVLHKDTHIENVRNISKSMPGESDFFHANPDRCAIPLAGPGGLINVLEFSKPGRLPDIGVPSIQHGSVVMDFVFDPFDNHRLVSVCDNAKVYVWRIPNGGLTEMLTEPEDQLIGHNEKIYFARFHPLAKDVVATGSYDMTVKIWDLATGEEQIQLNGHTDTIFSFAWSTDGKNCATVCKDGKIRLYDPRKSSDPIAVGPGPVGSRGARVIFVKDSKYIAVSGFSRSSERQLALYNPGNLKTPLHRVDLSISPAILVPHMDEDSSTLFLTGRGDSSVLAYEISDEAPYLFPLSTYTSDALHQALAFLPKKLCDVRQVEFAKAYKLTSHSVEPVSFTVPRVKSEYFQDDLFPETRVTWEPVMSSSEWFSGVNRLSKHISLRPRDMQLLSEAPVEAPKPKKYESYHAETYKTDEQKKDELMSAMSGKLESKSGPLPQDLTEGAEDEEWDD